jgi:hypothetical protein
MFLDYIETRWISRPVRELAPDGPTGPSSSLAKSRPRTTSSDRRGLVPRWTTRSAAASSLGSLAASTDSGARVGPSPPEAFENDRFDVTLWEGLTQTSQVPLETTDHHGFEVFGPHLDPAHESLRIQHLQQRGKRIGVPVVRRRAEEQSMFEPVREALGWTL